jgi:Rrf2 family protein
MKVPMRVDYGVRALVHLAENYQKGYVHTVEIAQRQSIPEAYLDQLLTAMGRFGLIHSRRGPQGGHVLARDPREINLGMVVDGLEGSPAPLDCMDQPDDCTLVTICAQREVWRSVEDAVHGVLESISIADLTDRQKALEGLVAR